MYTITGVKKNVTFTTEGGLLQAARKKAAAEGKTLNGLFRQWISAYVQSDTSKQSYFAVMKRLENVSSGRKFTRDEMNER